jgi:hypothetical protein
MGGGDIARSFALEWEQGHLQSEAECLAGGCYPHNVTNEVLSLSLSLSLSLRVRVCVCACTIADQLTAHPTTGVVHEHPVVHCRLQLRRLRQRDRLQRGRLLR